MVTYVFMLYNNPNPRIRTFHFAEEVLNTKTPKKTEFGNIIRGST